MMNGDTSSPEQKDSPHDVAKFSPKRRRFIWIVALVLVGLLLLVALTPTILSMGPFGRMALRAVNKHVNGTVEMKSWSLGWVSGFRFRGIKVVDDQGESVIEADAVIVRTTAFGLLGEMKNLRVIEVQSPTINVVLNEDGTNNLESLISMPETEPDSEEVDIRGRVLVHDGIVNLNLRAYDTQIVLAETGLDVQVESLKQPLVIQLTGKLGEERAQLVITGTASMPTGEGNEASGPEGTFNVKLDGMDLAAASLLAERFGSSIGVAGKANVEMDATLDSSGDMQVSGGVTLPSLALIGESRFLQDRPVFTQTVASFDVAMTEESIQISEFTIASPLFSGHAKGTVAISPEGSPPVADLMFSGEVTLAEVAEQFPKALALRQGLEVESGTLAFDANVKTKGAAAEGDLSVSLSNLGAMLDGKRIQLDAPVELAAKGSVDAEGRAKLAMLNLTSSFMTADGSGDQQAFQATLTSDLEAAMREISKFANLGGKMLSGKAEVALRASYADPSEPHVSASVELDRLVITGFLDKTIEMPDAGISFEGILAPSGAGEPFGVQDITGKFYFPVGGAEFSVARMTSQADGLPTVIGGQMNGKLNLGDTVALLRYLGLLETQIYAQGEMNYSYRFTSAGEVVSIEGLHAVIDPLKITGEEIPTIENERVVVDADMTLRPEDASVDISKFDLASGLAQIRGSASLAGSEDARVFEAQGEMKCDFDRIGPLVAIMTEQPIQMNGGAFRPFHIRTPLGGDDWREMLSKTVASAGTYMTSAGLPDIETGPVEMGATVRNGQATCKIGALVAGVNVNLPLVIDVMSEPMRLTMPADTPVLADARFSTGLADGFISRMSPLFKGCVVTAGSVDFTCRELSAPLDETAMQQATMQAGLTLKGVRLGSAGFLNETLDLFRISGYGIELPEQEVGIALREGRVHQDPISIQVSRYVLTLSGSVGLVDTDLDMLLKVPLTREMVGQDAYEVLKDEALEVRITGTTDAPSIQKDVIRSNIDTMLKTAVRDVVEDKAKDLIKEEVNKLLKDAIKGL